jgi:hypothetical protein
MPNFSKDTAFYTFGGLASLVALCVEVFLAVSIPYNFYQCNAGLLPPDCASFYLVDSILFFPVYFLLLAGMMSVIHYLTVIFRTSYGTQEPQATHLREVTAADIDSDEDFDDFAPGDDDDSEG